MTDTLVVLGSRTKLQLLERLMPRAASGIDEALARGVLRTDGQTIEFRHELARLAVLDAVPGHWRLQLHRQVLATMRGASVVADDLARLAYHAEAAADRAAVLEYAPATAAHAAALGAHREAAAQYARALRHADSVPPEQRAGLLERRARACQLASQMTEGIACLQEALELRRSMGDGLREGDDLRWMSFLLWPLGRTTEAERSGRAAVRLLESLGPSRELAWAYLNLCMLVAHRMDTGAAATYARRAVDLGEPHADEAVRLRARFHAAAASLLRTGEGWDELEQALESAIEHDLEAHAGFMIMLMAWFATLHRDFPRAVRATDRAVSYCIDHDLTSFLLHVQGISALGMLHRGHWSQAVDTAKAVLAHPSPPPITTVVPSAVLGLTRARRGERGVWPLLDQALEAVDPSTSLVLGPVWAARAEAAWLAGDDPRAEAEAKAGLAAADTQADPWLTGSLAIWIHRVGGRPPNVPAAGPFARELTGDWAGAADAWEETGCDYDAALTRLGGDVPALRNAFASFVALGAPPAVARARSVMRTRGSPVRHGPQASTRANPYGLSNRELEVLTLLSERLSNAQIAARLYISRKTADSHVTAILTKLGVHSRAEAAQRCWPPGGPHREP